MLIIFVLIKIIYLNKEFYSQMRGSTLIIVSKKLSPHHPPIMTQEKITEAFGLMNPYQIKDRIIFYKG